MKEAVIAECRRVLNERITNLKSQMTELVNDAANDSKSTAGDKHETSRAMMQLEQEKLGAQLKILEEQLKQLDLIPSNIPNDKVNVGSLVETNRGWIFIGVALGKVKTASMDVFNVSPQSPIGKLLLSQTVDQQLNMNGNTYRIISIH